MDIHKPKPWHGIREFLKEYVIIVVGVLTALGAEQIAENLHWRHVVAEERAALNSNVQGNDAAMRARLSIEPCVQRRLAELDELYRRHAHGEPLRIIGPIGRPAYRLGGTQAWEITVADQSLAHMPLDEKSRYVAAFSLWGSYYATHSDERSDWRDLQALDHAEEMTAADWSALRRVIERARDDDRGMQSGLQPSNWLAPPGLLHLPQFREPAVGTLASRKATFCSPMIAR